MEKEDVNEIHRLKREIDKISEELFRKADEKRLSHKGYIPTPTSRSNPKG